MCALVNHTETLIAGKIYAIGIKNIFRFEIFIQYDLLNRFGELKMFY